MRVIRSKEIMDDAARVAKAEIPRKRPVRVSIVARQGEPFRVALSTADGLYRTEASGFVVERARTKPVREEDLVEHVGRMGSTPFDPVSFDVELDDGCGMGFSAVHKVRAEACAALEREILADYQDRDARISPVPTAGEVRSELRDVRDGAGIARPGSGVSPEVEVCALVADARGAKAALEAGATRLYATTDALERDPEWPVGVVPVTDEVSRMMDVDRLDAWVRPGEPCAVGNVSQLVLARERGALAEVRGCIPVHNEACLVALEQAGAAGFWLSPELTLEEACDLSRKCSVPVGMVVSGRTRAMTSEHCVLQAADRCIHDCPRCKLRRRRISLRDRDGALLPVRTDVHGRSRIYAAHPLDATPQIDVMMRGGISRFCADATLLTPQETSQAVGRIVRAVAAAQAGRKLPARAQGSTSGHLFAPIG